MVLGALGCPSSTLFALPESPLGKIDLSVNARAIYDSNVFSMPSNTFNARKATTSSLKSSSDLILQLTPAAHFTKKIKLIELQGTLGARGAYFIRNKEKNYVDPITTFSFDFDESLTKSVSNNAKIRFDALFDLGQKTETSVLENDLTSYTYYSAGLNVRYNHSPKFGVGASSNYSYRDYQSESGFNQYQDVRSLPISARAYYIYSPKTDFFTEYTYTPTRGSGASNSQALDAKTHAFTVGAQGDLFTKASGSLRLGHTTKEYDKDSLSQNSLSLNADLSWKLNQKTSTSINLDRSFQPSPQNNSILSTSIGLSLTHRLNEKISGETHLTWSSSEFTGVGGLSGVLEEGTRTMDTIGLGLSLTKTLSKHLSAGVGYDYSSSRQSLGDFDRHMLFVDVNGRY